MRGAESLTTLKEDVLRRIGTYTSSKTTWGQKSRTHPNPASAKTKGTRGTVLQRGGWTEMAQTKRSCGALLPLFWPGSQLGRWAVPRR